MSAHPGSMALRPDEGEASETWPPQWMLDLERAHDQLRHASRLIENGAHPVIDLAPAAAALEKTFVALYDAFDERQPRLDATRTALVELDTVIGALTPAAAMDAVIGFSLEYLGDARKSLLSADVRLTPLVPRPPIPAPDQRASIDVPRLHTIDRPSLAPTVKFPGWVPPVDETAPPPIPKPRTVAELKAAVEEMHKRNEEDQKREAAAKEKPKPKNDQPEPAEDEPPPGFAIELPPVLTPEAFRKNRTRECFEEVAMIGPQRAPLLGDPWRSAFILERRLLWGLDAIVAMGPGAVAEIEPLVFDSPVKDPTRVFGITMILGCLAGRDALAAAERVFLAFEPGDPACAEQFAAALKLVTHPLLPLTLRTWLADSDPVHRAVAIDVLGYREMATVDELARAAVDAPEVAALALPYFALTSHPGLRDAIEAGLASDSIALREATWTAMSLSAHPQTANVLRKEMEGEHAERAAIPLAIVGDEKDAAKLLEFATARKTRPFINAVGWAGASAAVVPLMAMLTQDLDDDVKLAAAYALERITGAGLWESTLVEPEQIMVPDIPDADVGEPPPPPRLAPMVSDPRDMPSDGAPDMLEQPTVDVRRWQQYWNDKGPNYNPTGRFRRGWPYTPLIVLRELDTWRCTPGERRTLHRELIVRTGKWARFDIHDFVPVQEESLKAWQPLAASSSGQPGSWTLPRRVEMGSSVSPSRR
jgi:hypothetical protein